MSAGGVKRRALKPKAVASVLPVTVSQLTCFEVFGVDPRRFLEFLRQHPEIPRMHIGKLVLVEPAGWCAGLKPSHRPVDPRDEPADPPDEHITSVDEVLRKLGRERVQT